MSNAGWYAKKFGTNPNPQPEAPPLMIPNPVYQQQPVQYQQPQYQAPQQTFVPQPGSPQNYGYNYPGGQALADPHLEAAMRLAASATLGTTCPQCRSVNYMKVGVQSTQNGSFDVLRCYDCGYPLEQSGSKNGSLTGAKVVGDAKSARGNDSTNNWNPQQIVGRIDG